MHDINFTLTFASLYSYSRTEQNRTWYLFHIAVLLICGVSKYRLYITYMYTCNRLYCFIYVLSCMIPHLSCTGSRQSIHNATASQSGSETIIQKDNCDSVVSTNQLPVVQFQTPSSRLQDASSTHHTSTPLNHLKLGQFGTVPYQHGHSQIASSHNALSKYMPGQTLRPLYSTALRHLLYLEQSVSRLLEIFVPVQRIRDRHIRIPGITDQR